MSEQPGYRMEPGLGVIPWQGQIVVYQAQGTHIEWVRWLGGPLLPLSEALRAAIEADLCRVR